MVGNSSVFLRKLAVSLLIPTLFSTRTSMVNFRHLRYLKLSIIRMQAHKLALVSIVNHQRHYRCFSLRGQMFIVNFSKPQALSRDRCLVRRRKWCLQSVCCWKPFTFSRDKQFPRVPPLCLSPLVFFCSVQCWLLARALTFLCLLLLSLFLSLPLVCSNNRHFFVKMNTMHYQIFYSRFKETPLSLDECIL